MATLATTVGLTDVRAHDARAPAAFLAASIAVHALLAAGLPELNPAEVTVQPPLQVILERREPPQVRPATPLPMAPPAGTRERSAPRKKATKEVARQADRDPAAVRPVAPAPIIALPQMPDNTEPAFTASIPEAKPAGAAPGETAAGREFARAPPGREAGAAPKLTPPRLNAAYLNNPPPRYPLSARRRGEQGTVILKVLVTRDGLAAAVSVQTSSGSNALDDAAVAAVKSWRFVPAREGSDPIETFHLVPIVFKLDGVSS